MHQRASAWFAEVGLIEEALRHALAGGDASTAVTLVITQFHPMLDRQFPGPTLMRWLALFPPEMIQAHSGLLLAQLYLSAFGIGPAAPLVRLADVERQIQSDPTLPAGQRDSLLADIGLLRGVTAYWDGAPERAIALLQAALEEQSPTHLFVRTQGLIHLALAYTCTGESARGRTLLRTALAEAKAQQHPTLVVLLGGLAIFHLHAGELAAVIHTALQAMAVMDGPDQNAAWQGIGFVEMWYGWAHYLLGSRSMNRMI